MNASPASSPVTIRPLRWTEAHRFLALRAKIESEAPYLPASAGERTETLTHLWARLFLHRKRTSILAAKDGDTMVGYATIIYPLFKKFRNNLYITLAVDSSHRGKGIGTMLLAEIENIARKTGRNRIELEVFSKNADAVKLYERLGYAIEGRKKNAIQDESGYDDILLMAKHLR